MCRELTGVSVINWRVALLGMGACGRIKERILWLVMACVMESLWDFRNI